jgi:3-deoxy-7-phosphoheptulonate synthase
VDTWRSYVAAQQPEWPDPEVLATVRDELTESLPLVPAQECDRLRSRLAMVARGEAFLLQGGDCAETFEPGSAVAGTLRTLVQMAVVLSYATELPVVKVGRLAGQYAKPRSQSTESRAGVTLPAYRGDAVNGRGFTAAERIPDPARLLRMYGASSATLHQLHAFVRYGHPDLRTVLDWNRVFVAASPLRARYGAILRQLESTLAFASACGVRAEPLRAAEFYVSHEALLLDYESALTRTDPRTGGRYAGSGHLVWIGERTRQIDGAHVEFASRIRNPIAVKLGPTADADNALALVDRLDPDREPGRLTFITRMGASGIRDRLPTLVEKVAASGATVVWVCDPMHGNTYTSATGHKTRHLDTIMDEIRGFFEVHTGLGTHPGGIHLELTGDDVTECLGGAAAVLDLSKRYRSACDPRLNHNQAMDLAFLTSEMYLDRAWHQTP